MVRGTVRTLVNILIGALLVATAAVAVDLNLPVHPPTGFTSPTGTAAAPEIVRRVTGSVGAVPPAFLAAGRPAAAVDFLTPAKGWAIVGCSPSATDAVSPTARPNQTCTVLHTRDGGLTWETQWTTRRPLAGLAFATPRDGYVWTDGGACGQAVCPTRLYATRNGGRTWRLRFVGAAAWSSLVVTGPQTLWGVVGGELLTSVNGGRTWALRALPGCIPQRVQFSASGQDGVVTGVSSRGLCAFQTTDGGHTFTPLFTDLTAPAVQGVFAQFIADSGLGTFVGGTRGAQMLCTTAKAFPVSAREIWLAVSCDLLNPHMLAVWETTNGGSSWRLVWDTAGCATYCSERGDSEAPLALAPEAAAIFRAAPGGVARSTDGGRRFVAGGRLCAAAACLPRLDALSASQVYAATTQGVFASLNGGASWQRLWPEAGPGPLAAVSFVSARVGFAVPEIASDWIVRTEDGGRTWRPWARVPGAAAVSLIDFVAPTQGYVYGTRGGTGILWATRNGGRSFTVVSLPRVQAGTAQLASLAFRDMASGLAVDVFGDAWRTSDGGHTWTPLTSLPLGHPQQFAWASERTVYAAVLQKGEGTALGGVGSAGHFGLAVSHDGGRTWAPLAAWPWPPGPDQFAVSTVAAHGLSVWAFAYGGLMHSANGGQVWTETRLSARTLAPAVLTFATASAGWLLTTGGVLYATTDGGRTWRPLGTGSAL